jgi:ribonuclease HII
MSKRISVCGNDFESAAQRAGARLIAGVDEVGRGALAGPVVAAAVILNSENIPDGLDDSKKLTRRRREILDAEIRQTAIAFAVARIESAEIDRINILEATKAAMRQAINALKPAPDFLLIDALLLPDVRITQRAIIRGDAQSVSIAAASIIAKVARDRWMRDYDEALPGYDFAENAGYGTAKHLRALRRQGPTAIHRLSFRGVLPEKTLFENL